MLADLVDDELGMEPVGQDQRHAGEDRRRQVRDHAGDVEQRSQPEDAVGRRIEAGPVAERGGVERERRVGADRGFRRTRRPRGVREQCGVVRTGARRRRAAPGMRVDDFPEIVGACEPSAPGGAEHPRVVDPLTVELGGRHDVADRGRRDDLRCDIGVEHLEAHQGDGPGVAENGLELVEEVHRVDEQDRRARLPDPEHGDDELRDALHVHGDDVAAADVIASQPVREGVGIRVDLGNRREPVEVPDRRSRAVAGDRHVPRVDHRSCGHRCLLLAVRRTDGRPPTGDGRPWTTGVLSPSRPSPTSRRPRG